MLGMPLVIAANALPASVPLSVTVPPSVGLLVGARVLVIAAVTHPAAVLTAAATVAIEFDDGVLKVCRLVNQEPLP